MNQQRPPTPSDIQLQMLRKHLVRQPQDDRAYILLAGLQKKRGEFDDARRSLERALKIRPDSAEYWGMLAEIYFRHGQPEVAVKAASHSLQLDGKQFVALGIRAESYRQSGLWLEALSDFQQLEKHKGEAPQLLNKIGVCLIRLGRYETAAEKFNQALRLDPGFSMAKFNIGLLCAIRMKAEEAISQITEALEDPGIDSVTRQSGLATLNVLVEHKRLRPFLEQAEQSGVVNELQAALEGTPVALLQKNQQCADDLWELAALCRNLIFNPGEFSYTADTQYLPFIEACILCNIDSDAKLMAKLYVKLTRNPKEPRGAESDQKIMKAWNLNRDRSKLSADHLQHKEGEAWLRYWHARLVSNTPEILPGQYKAIENTIGVPNGKIQTPPEAVAATFRLLLADISPSVPDGPARAMFMYIAMCMIHGFGDGNGRLGRFMLAWETESAGMPALVVPLSLREELMLSLRVVLVENDLEPMFKLIKKAYAETNRLLQQFNTIMDGSG